MAANALRIPYKVDGQPSAPIVELTCTSANVAEGAVLVVGTSTDDTCSPPAAADIQGGMIGLAMLAGSSATGNPIRIITQGIYPAIANGTITRGQQVTVASSTGDVRAMTLADPPGSLIVGTALESATNGQRVAIVIEGSQSGGTSGGASGIVESFTVGSGGVTAGRPVILDTTANRQVIATSSADPRQGVVGIALATVAQGGTVSVVVSGATVITASGVLNRGDFLTVASSTALKSLGVSVMTGAGAQIVGYALDAATDGQTALAMIQPGDLAPNAEIEIFNVGSGGVTANTVVVLDLTANRQVIAATTADQRNGIAGVALATVAQNGVVPVVVAGPATVTANGAVTRADIVTVGSVSGTVKSYTTSSPLTTGIGAMAVGYALDSATDTNTLLINVGPFQIPNGIILPFIAGTGGTTANCAVVQDGTTNRQVVLPGGADPTSGVLGIALNTAIATAICFVQMHGVATVKDSGAGFARGAKLAIAGVNGQLKTAAPGAGTNDMIVGFALDTVGAGGTGLAFINPQIMQG